MERYIPGIGISAGSLMLKWNMINQHIRQSSLNLQPDDHINVFINFESVLKNIITRKGLTNTISAYKQNIVLELESSILNLVANYRMYFMKERCIPHIYLYHTNLSNNNQQMKIYNKYYRDYYRNIYMQNPNNRPVGNLLHDVIIPEIKLILYYVPQCYFIDAKTFDGSIIPYIISRFNNHKNVIISSDIFDTLYLFEHNFCPIYIKRRYQHFSVISEIGDAVQSIIKDENPFDLTIFNTELYYRLLLSIKGSKIRNIKSAKGFGYGKFLSIMNDGIKRDIILRDFKCIDSVLQLFPEKYHDDIKLAFQCMSLDTQYNLLSETDINEIKSQIIDKVDIDSIESLNNKRFLEFPINIQGLIN